MNDGGGRGQQLMMRQEIYFRVAVTIARNIQVFTRIFGGPLALYYAGSVRMRHISYPAPEGAFTAGCRVAAGTGPADRLRRSLRIGAGRRLSPESMWIVSWRSLADIRSKELVAQPYRYRGV
jgi:hypothetical protein